MILKFEDINIENYYLGECREADLEIAALLHVIAERIAADGKDANSANPGGYGDDAVKLQAGSNVVANGNDTSDGNPGSYQGSAKPQVDAKVGLDWEESGKSRYLSVESPTLPELEKIIGVIPDKVGTVYVGFYFASDIGAATNMSIHATVDRRKLRDFLADWFKIF